MSVLNALFLDYQQVNLILTKNGHRKFGEGPNCPLFHLLLFVLTRASR